MARKAGREEEEPLFFSDYGFDSGRTCSSDRKLAGAMEQLFETVCAGELYSVKPVVGGFDKARISCETHQPFCSPAYVFLLFMIF